MTVKELKYALKGIPDDADVFYDSLGTDYFKKVLDLFGRGAEYMSGEIGRVDWDEDSRTAWLEEKAR